MLGVGPGHLSAKVISQASRATDWTLCSLLQWPGQRQPPNPLHRPNPRTAELTHRLRCAPNIDPSTFALRVYVISCATGGRRVSPTSVPAHALGWGGKAALAMGSPLQAGP